jgi:Arc/MetJ-type ribon-helix-helix transcriptional regulator
LRQQFEGEVRTRFAGAPIQRVELLQYGDLPDIEPGQLLGRVVLEPPAQAGDQEARERRLEEFHDAHRAAIKELRAELHKLPVNAMLEFMVGAESAEDEQRGPRIKLAGTPRGLGGGEPGFTPVMARLGQEDLETLDTLITAGIAASRAEAVRWALARIRERPAYEQLKARAREIEELKSQF